MRKHISVAKIDEERNDQAWRHKVKITGAYVELKEEYIKKLSDFEFLWDPHLSQNEAGKLKIELSLADAKPTQNHTGQARMRSTRL